MAPATRRAPRHAPESLLALDAVELRDRLARGALKAVDLARACLDRARAVEDGVHAFAWLDEGHAMAEAERLDRLRGTGRALGPLHGLPVAVKDVIDTARIPTANGTPLDEGRVPATDAAVVRRLRAAGAYVLGKTVTAELAYLHPGATTNPHDPARTPGGSSQGSAAAVAAGMAPLAIGTQTGGSVIRPASYCGVVGYKPTFGMVPRTGILSQAPSLDTVGVFASSPGGAALLADALAGDDPMDRATQPAAPPRLLATALAPPPVRPTLAIATALPGVALDPDMVRAMEELFGHLGDHALAIDLPPLLEDAARARETVNLAEMARAYGPYAERGAARLSPVLREALDRGRAVAATDYLAALDWARALRAVLDEVLSRCDALVCPAATGPAPSGLGSTGSAACNGPWTLCGVPVVTLPLFRSGEGMPMGVQLIGRPWDDARLLRTAQWLWTDILETEGHRP